MKVFQRITICFVFAFVLLATASAGGSDERRTYRLRAFVNTSGAAGQFFLGCGSFEEADYFLAYIELLDGSVKLIRAPASHSYIREHGEQGFIPTMTKYVSNNGWGHWTYIFDIPAGSIAPVFNATKGWDE